MSNDISIIGSYGVLFTPSSASFTLPTTKEADGIENHLNEDSWLSTDTTKPYGNNILDTFVNELQTISSDFFNEYNKQILPKALDNAFHILSEINEEGLEIPSIAANGEGEIGLTWDSSKHRIYLAIDGYDRLFLSIVNHKRVEEYDCSQRTIKEENEILSKIRKVL